jgi:hypothetical protein
MIKKNVKIKTIENVAQEKIDAIKLESHVHAVKNGKHVNVTDE